MIDIPYPGFESRPRAASWEAFLEVIAPKPPMLGEQEGTAIVYATGVGGLLALCLRARGEWLDLPLVMQGPVLWGLERRLMPRLMRLAPTQSLLRPMFANPLFQRRFVRKYFTHPPSPETQRAFFDGYARCAALPDLFRWLTPALLRELEAQLAAHPERLANIRVWWGGQDGVVSLQELRWTEKALHTTFPLRVFPDWGHYPMMDDSAGWAAAVAKELVADA